MIIILFAVWSISCPALRIHSSFGSFPDRLPDATPNLGSNVEMELWNPAKRPVFSLVAHNKTTGHMFVRGDRHITLDGLEHLRDKLRTLAEDNGIPLKKNFKVRLISLAEKLSPDQTNLPGFEREYGGMMVPTTLWDTTSCLNNSGPAHPNDQLADYHKMARLIHQEMQDAKKMQKVIVTFCYVGCDRTGLLVGSYKMQFESFDLKSFYAENIKVCQRGMVQCFHSSLETMCSTYFTEHVKETYQACETDAKCRVMTQKEMAYHNPQHRGVKICDYTSPDDPG